VKGTCKYDAEVVGCDAVSLGHWFATFRGGGRGTACILKGLEQV
jgi:hypothetical protein